MPLSERAKEILTKRFGNAEFYIGLDPAILLRDSQVITAGLIFIPMTLLIAVLVPGNQVLVVWSARCCPSGIWRPSDSFLL